MGMQGEGVRSQEKSDTKRVHAPASPAPVQQTPEQKRDPFKVPEEMTRTPPQCPEPYPTRPRGPLERFDISALKLVGIVRGDLGWKALIKTPDGKSHFATLDTYMGQYNGKVIAIEHDRLMIEQRYVNAACESVTNMLTIPLRRKDKKAG